MEQNEHPAWFDDGLKVLDWLSKQRDRNDIFFYPFAIAARAKVPLITVKLAIQHAGQILERRGNQVRYNREFAIIAAMQQHLETGMIERAGNGYRLTAKGEQYARSLIAEGGEMAEFYQSLIGNETLDKPPTND